MVSPIGTIVEVVLVNFVGGFLYIQFIATVGKSVGGQETQTSNEEMRRVLSYAYVAWVIEGVLFFIDDSVGSVLTTLIWVAALIYAFLVFIFAVQRALDKGFGTALITVIIAYIGKLIVEAIIIFVMLMIFGDTYFILR